MDRLLFPPPTVRPRSSPGRTMPRPGQALLLGLVFAAPASADRWYFDIDPAQSVIQVLATVELADFGVSIPAVGQGARGVGIPSSSDGSAGQFDGTLVGDIDLEAGNIFLRGGTITGLASGLWEPGGNGAPGLEPAFLGVMIEDLLGVPARAVGALRDVRADYFASGAPTTLEPLNGGVNRFQFVTNEWLAVDAKLDVQGQSGLATFLGSQRFELYERYAARNLGQAGSLEQTEEGDWQIQIPLDISLALGGIDDTPIGTINLSFRIQGQIVGRAVPPPEPPPIGRNEPGNDNHENAQPINHIFSRSFDPNFTDGLANNSLLYAHATIEGIGDETFDFYHFTVEQADALGLFDLEGADFAARLFVFDEEGNLLASSARGAFSVGSAAPFDTHLGHTFERAGQYTVAVGRFDSIVVGGELVGSGPPAGAVYTMRISVVPEASGAFLVGIASLGAAGIRRGRNWGRRTVVL